MSFKLLHFALVSDYADAISVDSYLKKMSESAEFEFVTVHCGGCLDYCLIQKFKGRGDDLERSKRCSNCISNCSTGCVELASFDSSIWHQDVENFLSLYSSEFDKHVEASLARYYGSASFLAEKTVGHMRSVVRRNAELSIRQGVAVLKEIRPDVVFMHHGIYIPQAIFLALCNFFRIPCYVWWKSYRRDTLLFSLNRTYHSEFQDMARDELPLMGLVHAENYRNYVKAKYAGVNSDDDMRFSSLQYRHEVSSNVAVGQKVVAVFTNVAWDAISHDLGGCFQDQSVWLDQVVDFARFNPEVRFFIRLHPADKLGTVRNRDPWAQKAKLRADKKECKNIVWYTNADDVSSYALIERSHVVLTYASKISIEALALGVDVLPGGKPWGSGLGCFEMSLEPVNYFKNLSEKLVRPSKSLPDRSLLAAQFGYYLFFRRMISINVIEAADQALVNKLVRLRTLENDD